VPHADGLSVYAGTGDGMLHAFDAGGDERWAFVPAAFLTHLDELRLGRASGTRHAGLDAELAALVVDADADGTVRPGTGDRAVLYFGLRRGGRAYLAVDVTDPDAPRRLWTLTPRELPALGQTWATPVPARLTIAGTRQNADRRVVLLTGGHDPSQDVPRPRDRDRIGAALYLVDAYTGALLWHASGRVADAPDLVVRDLEYAVAATPRALDVDEDGELDRAYVADTGGRLFRFDFRRGADRGALAAATLLADVGGTGGDDRRFYAEPDVALVRPARAPPHLAITLGTGFAPDPNAQQAADRLYSFRDPLGAATRAVPLTDAMLPDAAAGAVAPDAPGWKYVLASPGEKIVAGARTVEHRVYVPAYVPPVPGVGADCTAPVGTSRLYALDIRDARRFDTHAPASAPNTDTAGDADAVSVGVAPAVAVVGLAAQDCAGDCPREVVALLGTERVDVRWPGRIVRTGFAERGVE
jgi:type IV pilus assembly protein PilY1